MRQGITQLLEEVGYTRATAEAIVAGASLTTLTGRAAVKMVLTESELRLVARELGANGRSLREVFRIVRGQAALA